MKKSASFKDIKTYYNVRYDDESRSPRPVEHYAIYLKYLRVKNEPQKKILDIACGQGDTLLNAEKYELNTFGLDISFNAIQRAKARSKKSEYVLSSGEDICFKERTFDYICCLGSLEHFLNIQKALSEIKRTAKQTAKICIMVPNIIHYRLDSKTKWGVKKIIGTQQKEMHEELHSFKEWKEILEGNGLKITKVKKDRFFIKKRDPLKNFLFYLWLICLPFKYSYQFIFICKID